MAFTPYYQPNYPTYFPAQDQMRQAYMPQMQPQIQQMPQAQPQQSGPIWVQGEAAAKAYLVAPGQSVMLLDSENESFYLKATDVTGVPQRMRTFDYKERMDGAPGGGNAAPDKIAALEAKIDALTAMIAQAMPRPQAAAPPAPSEHTQRMRRIAHEHEEEELGNG